MKYLVFTILRSLSIAQAMERQSLEQMRLSSMQTRIEQEKTTLTSEFDTLSKTMIDRDDYVALYEKELTMTRLKSRLAEVTDMLQWIQQNNPPYKEISGAFISYQKMCDRLMVKATETQKAAAYWEGIAKKTKVKTSATLEAFTEEDDEELTQEQVPPARSQSVIISRNVPTVTAPRAYSAPVIKIHHSRSRYGVSPQSLNSIKEVTEEEIEKPGTLSILFDPRISLV